MSNSGFRQFVNVLSFAVMGIVSGLILGFIFGTVIVLIVKCFAVTAKDAPPLQVGMFLGMGAGSVVGGIFGGIIGYKK